MDSGVYKMGAHYQLLLLVGVCRQFCILLYHPDAEPWRGGRKQNQTLASSEIQGENAVLTSEVTCSNPAEVLHQYGIPVAEVSMVHIRLVQSVRLLPDQRTSVAQWHSQETFVGRACIERWFHCA